MMAFWIPKVRLENIDLFQETALLCPHLSIIKLQIIEILAPCEQEGK